MKRYVDNKDGTIIDNKTGLMWQKESKEMNWVDAIKYAKNLTLSGHDDWRLPTIHELTMLIDYEKLNPASKFPNTISSFYWSSSTCVDFTGYAWSVYFHRGNVDVSNKEYKYHARCVRGQK